LTEGTREFFGEKAGRALEVIKAGQSIQYNLTPPDLVGAVTWLVSDASRLRNRSDDRYRWRHGDALTAWGSDEARWRLRLSAEPVGRFRWPSSGRCRGRLLRYRCGSAEETARLAREAGVGQLPAIATFRRGWDRSSCITSDFLIDGGYTAA